jgi:hypothetical protein
MTTSRHVTRTIAKRTNASSALGIVALMLAPAFDQQLPAISSISPVTTSPS